jgi:hypothetical protein
MGRYNTMSREALIAELEARDQWEAEREDDAQVETEAAIAFDLSAYGDLNRDDHDLPAYC